MGAPPGDVQRKPVVPAGVSSEAAARWLAWSAIRSASSVAVFLTLQLARLVVLRTALYQAMYLLLRRHIDRVPMDSIDGYRPDDSAFDPTAQGFVLSEVEEELRSGG